jgi:hypothetical protein
LLVCPFWKNWFFSKDCSKLFPNWPWWGIGYAFPLKFWLYDYPYIGIGWA